ncbi:MAG: thioredoxin [Spirochaetaceae bacterium]|jgi:thioredoxin 1|nr:thioredoxin [Spirochaetaceae bacterium]
MFNKAIHITSDNFESEVIKSDIPVLLIFSAEWCSTCQVMEGIVESAMKDFDKKIKFAVLDIDNEKTVCDKFGVLSVPTFMLFKGGVVTNKTIGAVPRSLFTAFLTGR